MIQKPTPHMGICSLHWPENVAMYRPPRSRYLVPKVAPSIFSGVPASHFRQTCSSSSRQIHERAITSEQRTFQADEMELFNEGDVFKTGELDF